MYCIKFILFINRSPEEKKDKQFQFKTKKVVAKAILEVNTLESPGIFGK